MRLPPVRPAVDRLRARLAALPTRGRVRLVAAALLVVVLAVAGVWTARYSWAIFKLNRGVGDTVFLDAQGRPWFRLDEQRRDVPLEQISTSFKDAVIAVEDHRYYAHPGIDPIGLGRALWHNVRSDAGMQGGSTITQQLARTLFLSNTRTIGRKAQEAALAVLLEVFLSKREILELYLNRVYLSGGIYGIETMSQKMLRKPASELTLAEAATIAGIIRAPAVYSPWNNPEAARERRAVVLRRMREEGKITAEQEAEALKVRLRVQRPAAATAKHGYAKDYLRQQFRALYGDDNPPDWQVRTTFDPALQDAAEAAVRAGLRRQGVRGLQAALVALDPHTGDVLAVVGGSDYGTTPFNRAVRSRRQPGSAFKPFVYAAALNRGRSPVSVIGGLQEVSIQAAEGVWIPRDERATGKDALTLREALIASNNAAAVQLQQEMGARPVLRLASRLGVENQPDVPSLALGSGLVTPLDLTAAYAVFPSLGYAVRPRGITAILDGDGDVVHETAIRRERVLSPEVSFQMVSMLQDVVARGTARSVRSFNVRGPVGGKTGTTNDYHDAWFVGFSSSVVAGVWVGFDQPETIRQGGSGARVAIPIWAEFMRRAASARPPQPIEPPATLETHKICLISYQRALQGCPSYDEYFKRGDDVPSRACPLHSGTFGEEAGRAVRDALGAIGRGIRDIFR